MSALQLELPGLTLEVRPTTAMRDGRQRIFQCAQCGTVVVQADPADLGPCPSCHGTTWWRQHLPLAGLSESEGAL